MKESPIYTLIQFLQVVKELLACIESHFFWYHKQVGLMLHKYIIYLNNFLPKLDYTVINIEEYLPKIWKAYDAFLAEFPLCYGYWKKYADHEARSGSAKNIVEVYEWAVQAVTYSVDIWRHYEIFAMSTYEDPETIREGS